MPISRKARRRRGGAATPACRRRAAHRRVDVRAVRAAEAARIASTRTRHASSARIRRAACIGRPTTCIAPTIAATRGLASAPIFRATSIATRFRSWASCGPPTRSPVIRRRRHSSNIVAIDESPLLEGLLYAGTDDGLVQVTDDGGKNWRKIEQFPGVPQWTYVTDVFASPREADTVFVTLNNWQRGDYKPYIVKSVDRGKTWTNITSNLPDKHDVWSIVQDHVNGDLLFAGTEFGLFTSVDGGKKWVQLRGGMPPAQVRDVTVQKRETDLVLATFGRGFYILDDYSALREISPAALADDARLFPLRDASLFSLRGLAPAGSAGLSPLSGLWRAENPPFGAVFTYHLRRELPADARLVVSITDEGGKLIRRMEIDKGTGLRRAAWNLRGDPPAAPAGGAAAGRGGAGGRGFGGGRGAIQPPLVEPGRYRATLGSMSARRSPLGAPRTFSVVGPGNRKGFSLLPPRVLSALVTRQFLSRGLCRCGSTGSTRSPDCAPLLSKPFAPVAGTGARPQADDRQSKDLRFRASGTINRTRRHGLIDDITISGDPNIIVSRRRRVFKSDNGTTFARCSTIRPPPIGDIAIPDVHHRLRRHRRANNRRPRRSGTGSTRPEAARRSPTLAKDTRTISAVVIDPRSRTLVAVPPSFGPTGRGIYKTVDGGTVGPRQVHR